jgi:hypothetical protein
VGALLGPPLDPVGQAKKRLTVAENPSDVGAQRLSHLLRRNRSMRTKAAVATGILGLFLAVGVTTTAGAQTRKNTLTTRASTGRGPATSDQNIKTAKAPNTKGKVIPAPVKKGGVRTRGGADLCQLNVDNHTPLSFDLYINRDYEGTVPPWGAMEGYVTCGSNTFYARADLDDGTYLAWGPVTAYVSRPFLWTISP